MSRAWYKPHATPQLVESISRSMAGTTTRRRRRRRTVQVWNTTCAVTKAGKASPMACSVLITPANPQLSGVSKFPYFPKGGPAPKEYPQKDSHHIMGYVTQWGGMEVGGGMLFAANVVDGLVHQLGGWRLALECQYLPVLRQPGDERCPVGHAVVTGPGGAELQAHFDRLVHTVPPFYDHHPDPEHFLREAYRNSLAVAFGSSSRVACPLLGAGGRGFPLDIAIRLAGEASRRWLHEQDEDDEAEDDDCHHEQALAFAIPDMDIAEKLVESIKTGGRVEDAADILESNNNQ